jgi:hypothetical protein
MIQKDLLSTSTWKIPLDLSVDLTGKVCHFVISGRDNSEIARAASTGATGTIGVTGTHVDITIPVDARPDLMVPKGAVWAYGDLGIENGTKIEWIGRWGFKIIAGPTWS